MEKEEELSQPNDNSLTYIVGAIIVVAVVVAAVLVWPKTKSKERVTSPASEQNVGTKPTFTKLQCEKQWYNPMVGSTKFYLSAEGGDIEPATKADCTFTVFEADKVIKTEKVPAIFTAAPERGGNTLRCTTKALEGLPVNTQLKMVTTITDDVNTTATCTGIVTFKPQY